MEDPAVRNEGNKGVILINYPGSGFQAATVIIIPMLTYAHLRLRYHKKEKKKSTTTKWNDVKFNTHTLKIRQKILRETNNNTIKNLKKKFQKRNIPVKQIKGIKISHTNSFSLKNEKRTQTKKKGKNCS